LAASEEFSLPEQLCCNATAIAPETAASAAQASFDGSLHTDLLGRYHNKCGDLEEQLYVLECSAVMLTTCNCEPTVTFSLARFRCRVHFAIVITVGWFELLELLACANYLILTRGCELAMH
jgi:hypothetical protein